uniref:Putative secreted protein n=1 Tax=Xenopsylla cheopis TaxID=163159 RepID=A0A6M2DUY6_XENCH
MPRFRHTVYTLLIYLVNCDLTTCSPCKNGTKISTKSKFISRNDNSPLLYLEQERSQLSGHKNSTEKSIHRFQG